MTTLNRKLVQGTEYNLSNGVNLLDAPAYSLTQQRQHGVRIADPGIPGMFVFHGEHSDFLVGKPSKAGSYGPISVQTAGKRLSVKLAVEDDRTFVPSLHDMVLARISELATPATRSKK